MKTKKCPRCRVRQPTTAFQKNSCADDGMQYHCRACRKAIDARPEKRAADRNAYHTNKPRYLNSTYKRMYGIDLSRYNALFLSQGGLCAICKRLCPTGRRLAVDHDHKTKRVRGLLCAKCNPMLGNANDSPAVLRAAADYLEK